MRPADDQKNFGYNSDADFIVTRRLQSDLANVVRSLVGRAGHRRRAYLQIELFMRDLEKLSFAEPKAGNETLTNLLRGLNNSQIVWPIAPLLAWLRYHHEEQATAFYKVSGRSKETGLDYRRYSGEPGERASARKSVKIDGVSATDTCDLMLLFVPGDNLGDLENVTRSLKRVGLNCQRSSLSLESLELRKVSQGIASSLVPILYISPYLLTKMKVRADLKALLDRLVSEYERHLLAIRSGASTSDIRRQSAPLAALSYLETAQGEGVLFEQLQRAVQLRRDDEGGLDAFRYRLDLRRSGQVYVEETLSMFYNAENTKPMSAAMIDVDKLAQINRKFGYDTGDYLVYALGGLIAEHLTGRSFRSELCGADAYVIVVPTDDDVQGIFQSLVKRIAEYDWTSVKPGLQVTCSLGFAVRQEREAGLDVAICAAMGMNIAKSKGGNRTAEGPRQIAVATSRRVRTYVS